MNAAADTAAPTYEKGTWQDTMQKSSVLAKRGDDAKKKAGVLLWTGTQAAIETWLPNVDADVSAEGLYEEVKDALGESRKGDASKIKTVAVAVAHHGLDLSSSKNLSQAYNAARALTVVAEQQKVEDGALDKAVEGIEAPKTTGSVEGAAALLLSKGIEGAVVALLDALGANNFDAHKALVREFQTEIASRVQAAKPKPAPKPAKPKKATASTGAAKKATAAKPASGKTKGKPVGTAPKATAAPVEEPVVEDADPVDEDMFDAIEGEEQGEVVETPTVPVAKRPAGGKGRPVVRRPARNA